MKQFTVVIETDKPKKFKDPYYDFLEYELMFRDVGFGEKTTVTIDISTPGESKIYGKLAIDNGRGLTFVDYKLNEEDGNTTVLRVENVRIGQDRITVTIIHNKEPIFSHYELVPIK